MAIYDCFQYFNEDHIVDLRMNILDPYVDFFVISESTKTHQGHNKKINFDIKNFPQFKDKIKFLVADYDKKINFENHTGGESIIEQHQRNYLINGLKDASIILQSNDIIYVQPNPNYVREILSDITPVLGLISTATSLWATYLIISNQ